MMRKRQRLTIGMKKPGARAEQNLFWKLIPAFAVTGLRGKPFGFPALAFYPL